VDAFQHFVLLFAVMAVIAANSICLNAETVASTSQTDSITWSEGLCIPFLFAKSAKRVGPRHLCYPTHATKRNRMDGARSICEWSGFVKSYKGL
jgi:hypothetical protein